MVRARGISQPLASVLAEICQAAGVEAFDVRKVHGIVRGYAMREVQSARADLQPLMLAHGIEAAERNGVLEFYLRQNVRAQSMSRDDLVREGDEPVLSETRSPDAELVGRVRLHHLDAEGKYEARVGEAVLPEGALKPGSDSELPLALTREEGVAIAERFLAEAQTSRETVRLQLPPSRRDVRAGDTLRIEGLNGDWRIDRIEETGGRAVEATRTDGTAFVPSRPGARAPGGPGHRSVIPVRPVVLDLPLLRGTEVAHAPYVAARAQPWPGKVTVMSSEEDAGYRFDTALGRAATVGVTMAPLVAASPGLLDRGAALRVRFGAGQLQSRREAGFLAGQNALAIGSGQTDDWEVMQFQIATPVEPGVWDLSLRLRGQSGTECAMRDVWPTGSLAVLIDPALRQLDVSPDGIGLERHIRMGPSRFAVDHWTYRHATFTPQGVGFEALCPGTSAGRCERELAQRELDPQKSDGGAIAGTRRSRWARRANATSCAPGPGDRSAGRGRRRLRRLAIGAQVRAGAGISGAYRLEVAQYSPVYGPGCWAGITVA